RGALGAPSSFFGSGFFSSAFFSWVFLSSAHAFRPTPPATTATASSPPAMPVSQLREQPVTFRNGFCNIIFTLLYRSDPDPDTPVEPAGSKGELPSPQPSRPAQLTRN